jgi:hypothetical protein
LPQYFAQNSLFISSYLTLQLVTSYVTLLRHTYSVLRRHDLVKAGTVSLRNASAAGWYVAKKAPWYLAKRDDKRRRRYTSG